MIEAAAAAIAGAVVAVVEAAPVVVAIAAVLAVRAASTSQCNSPIPSSLFPLPRAVPAWESFASQVPALERSRRNF